MITDTEQRAIETTILRNPTAGALEAGVRKIRIALPGHGKRGGGAGDLLLRRAKGQGFYLLDLDAKNVRSSLTQSEKNAIRKLTKSLKEA